MPDLYTPPQSVLDAFGIEQPLQPLSGGRGLCFLAGDVVLRPVDDAVETEWMSVLLYILHNLSNRNYRVPKPFPNGNLSRISPSNQFIADGWTASSFLPGKDRPKGRWNQLFNASRAFHRDLKDLVQEPPVFLSSRTHRWAQADRVTWDEKPLNDIPDVDPTVLELIKPYLARLEGLKEPLSKDVLVCQLIHGDLTGNVLFDMEGQDLPPAIIDISLYWRPVEYSEAIVVADGLLDHAEGSELILMYGTDKFRLQLLVRAVYWRILTLAIQPGSPSADAWLQGIDFDRAVTLVSEAFVAIQTSTS